MSNKFFSFFSKEKSSAKEIKTLTSEMLAFLESFPTAILLLDATGKVAFVNPSAALLLQMKSSSIVGMNVERFGLTMSQVRSMTEAKSATKRIIIQLVNRNADSVFVGAGASILASTPYIMLTLEAVPHFKQLNADKAFLRSALDQSPAALTVHNTAGVCLLWSAQAEKMFGVKSNEVQGRPIYDFFPKEIVQSLQRLDEQIRAGKQPEESVRLSYTNAEGKNCILDVVKSITLGDGGQESAAVLTAFKDITALSERKQKLVQNRNLLRAVLDNVPLGLYTRDIDGDMTYYNAQSMRILGDPDSKYVNKAHLHQTEEDVTSHRVREKKLIEEGRVWEGAEETYIDSSGNEKVLHIIKVPLMDAGPKPVVLSIVEDITDRVQRSKEISRSNSLLSSILQNAPIGLYARTLDGKILLRNKLCEQIFGNVAEESFDEKGGLPHETVSQLDGYLSREKELLATGKMLDIPMEEYVTANGEKKLLHLIKVPVNNEKSGAFVTTLVEDVTAKYTQEHALAETKNFLQTLLDHLPVAIYARRTDGTIVYTNYRARQFFPDDEEYTNKADFYGRREDAIFKEGKVVEIPEEWYTNMRGKKMLFHLVKAPVFDKEGNPAMVLTVVEDITEKKAQERAIVDAKNFLQAVINNLPVSLSVKNYDGKYILWNKKSEDLFGVMADEVIGKTAYREDLSREQVEFLRDSDLRVFESKREQNIPQELISTAREGVRIMHTVKTPVFNEDGTPNCLLVVSEDITAKTKMEKQIREASDKNTLLVENAREGIVILEDGKIIYANQALCRLLGYENVKEVTGKKLLNLAEEEHQIFLKDKCDAVLAGGDDAVSAIDVHFLRKNGTAVETEFAAMAARYLGRRIVLCFVRDVTTSNRMLRDIKTDRECFRSAFEKSITPAFILSHKGYISVMNEAARTLFGFTESDKNFYRNVYMRPAISLNVRKNLKLGQAAHMEYVFDFARAAEMFPGRVKGEGKLNLSVDFVPINKRDMKDGTVEADYVVFLEKITPKVPVPPPLPPAPPKAPVLPAPLPPVIPAAPAAPEQPVFSKTASELLVLPNSEPYVLCGADWKIEVCNELFCSLCQLTETELLGRDIRQVFAEESQVLLESDLKVLETDGSLANRDYLISLGSGLETSAVRLTAVKEADGRYLFVLRNMAFHRQIMHILEERSAQLNALLEATDGVVFSIFFENGHFGKIEEANKFLSQKLGFSHDELLRMKFKDLFANPDDSLFASSQEALYQRGKTSFKALVRKQDGSSFLAQVVLTLLDLPNKDAALVVLHDLSEQLDEVAKSSKEAQELKSVRQALPGIYLKTDSDGRVLEVYSNLRYMDNAQAEEIFLDKKPVQYWPEEAASRALFAIKEALSINVNTRFEFVWTLEKTPYHFEASVTPILGRAETVLWVKDISDQHAYDEQIHELYRLSSGPGLSITEQVDKILAFGLKTFRADVGLVLRFEQGKKGLESNVTYVTKNDFNLERHMQFPIEECLVDVPEGNVVMFPDLENAECSRCLHKEKGFGALVAAPLYVSGKVVGALCFASRKPRRSFEQGAEELVGIMSRLLSLRIELRQTGKMLSDASRSFARTLEFVEMPAVMMDLDYQLTFANKAFLQATGRRLENMLGRDFFSEVIRNDDFAKRIFKDAQRASTAASFQVKLDLLQRNGMYQEVTWDVFPCKDADGKVDAYALAVART